MYIRNATIAVIFRVIFIIVCGAGLVVKLMDSGMGPDVLLGDFALAANALALIYFAYLVIARPGYERGTLRGAVTIYMILTFIVYYYIEFGTGGISEGGLSLAGYLLWFISPVMAFIDYLLFCPKGWFTSYCPVIWAVIPVLFNVAVYIVNLTGTGIKRIAYFDIMGMNHLLTLLVFLGISYLLFLADSLMAGRRR